MRASLPMIFVAGFLLAGCAGSLSDQPAAAVGQATAAGAPRAQSLQEQIAQAGDRVFFDFDKSDLRADARRTIEQWAAILKQNPNANVLIEGHCDERGTREYNLGLGERRANATRNYLVSQGIEARRVASVSYGKERPAVSESNERAWSQNRRAVLVVR